MDCSRFFQPIGVPLEDRIREHESSAPERLISSFPDRDKKSMSIRSESEDGQAAAKWRALQKGQDKDLAARLQEAEREKKARVEAAKKERKALKAAQLLEKRKAAQKAKLAKKKAEWLAGGRQQWMEKQKEKRAKAAAKKKAALEARKAK